MADIRVYELAKQLGLDNKELKKILVDNGIEVKSHMSSVSEKDVEIVKKALNKNSENKANQSKDKADKEGSKEKKETNLTLTRPFLSA